MENSNSFQGLRTCIYRVDDMNKAKAWYSKILGIAPYFDEPFYVGFNVGGYELGLQPLDSDMPKRTDNVMIYWGVKDVAQKFKELIESGARMHEKPQNVGGEIVVASVKDPWDNVLGIIYNPEFKIG
jgi:predicted enzyme related to lactoylglutathione lyase